TPDIIGKVFEKFINQRENGAYYTDDDTINYILDKTIIPNIINRLNNNNTIKKNMNEAFIKEKINTSANMIEIFNESIDRTIYKDVVEFKNILDSTTIADISVGTGAFLVNCIDYLIKLYNIIYTKIDETIPINQIMNNILSTNIYGMDIMEDSVNIAKFRVILKSIQICRKYHVDIEEIPGLNFYVGNSLLQNLKELLPEVNKNGGFDIIIGNPPYIEYSKIKNYTLIGYETLSAGNIYAFMIEKSIDFLKPYASLGVIVPIFIVYTVRMGSLRSLLSRECETLWFANFADRPGTLFNGVHQKLTIVLGKKSEKMKNEIFTTNYI